MKMNYLVTAILALFVAGAVRAQSTDAKIKTLTQLEKEWTALLDKKDTTALRAIFTPNYVVNNATGKIVGVADIFNLLANGHQFPRVDRNIERITFADNLAIVIGGEIEYAKDGTKKNRRFTNVWTETKTGWKLVCRQANGN